MKILNLILKIVILLFAFSVVGIFGYIIYDNILEPSYMSYAGVCVTDFNSSDYGYVTLAQTDINTSEVSYYIQEYTPIYYQVSKHENVHVNQINRGVKFNCGNLFILEIEAYIGQYLPDFIYNLVYEKY